MDKTYFKAELVTFGNMEKNYHYGYESSTTKSKLDYYVLEKFRSDLEYKYCDCEYKIEIKEPEIFELLDKKYKFKTKYRMDIIFEIVYDDNNKPYAKEIITGTIFPIIDENDFTKTYEAIYMIKKIDYDNVGIPFACDYRFDATPIHHITNPNILNLMYFVEKGKFNYSTQMELEEYIKQFSQSTFLGIRTKNKELFDKLKKFYKNNTYKDNNFKYEKEKEEVKTREEFNPCTKVMENIEFLLIQVNKVDKKQKEIIEKKYKLLLEQENKELTLSPLTLESLKALEAELEFIIKFQKKQNDDIISCLDNMIKEYEEGITKRTIKDIDKLSELFLKMKNTYSLTDQRKIMEKFANLYILEIYENKNTITIEVLANSYYNDILKSIIIYLSEMIDNDIIENNIIINFDNITPIYILNLIKQIVFKPKTKDKQISLNN